ncbi:hypothetical protein DL93DRAFT_377375 [Clavulina sp. PMI_390]|nr:hypothetical protein DL93DRAFT_377375 [Clavulina sp. PMI_390]
MMRASTAWRPHPCDLYHLHSLKIFLYLLFATPSSIAMIFSLFGFPQCRTKACAPSRVTELDRHLCSHPRVILFRIGTSLLFVAYRPLLSLYAFALPTWAPDSCPAAASDRGR